jgi:hypothetical protein
MSALFCVSTVAEKLVDRWTLYACMVGCEWDTTKSFREVRDSIGYKQFVDAGVAAGLNIDQVADCWDLVKLNLGAIRSHRV